MIIEATHIHKSFGSLEVLKGIDLTVAPREIISIVGASGAGKTTLLQILGTLEAPAEGASLKICGEEVTRLSARRQAELRNRQIGFIFQAHQLLPEFTALENVMLPALIGGESRSKVRERALGLLERLGLAERASHKPAELSGGESQRVAVARALINRLRSSSPTNHRGALTRRISKAFTSSSSIYATNSDRPSSSSPTTPTLPPKPTV